MFDTHHHHYHYYCDDPKVAAQLQQLSTNLREGLKHMADEILDAAAVAKANMDAVGAKLTGIQNGVTALDQKIAALEATITSPTPDQVAALQGLKDQSAALLAQAGGIDTTVPA